MTSVEGLDAGGVLSIRYLMPNGAVHSGIILRRGSNYNSETLKDSVNPFLSR